MDRQAAAQHIISLNSVTVPSLINIAIKHGVNAETLLNDVGISAESVNDPKASITLGQLDILYQACGRGTGSKSFGLYMGSMTRLDSLNLVGSLIGTADSLYHALAQYHRFRELLHPFMNLEVNEKSNEAIISYTPSIANEITLQPCYSEMFLAGLQKIIGGLVAKPFTPTRMEFIHSAPAYAETYEQIFKAPVHFQSQRNAIIFDAKLLDEPLPGSYPELNESFEIQAEKYLMNLNKHKSVEKQIIRYLQENIGVRPLSMKDAASRLNITTRTLQRRLKKENTSYVTIRESVRFEQAQSYLQETSINIDEIASKLGFSEPTNFYHAFKRWSAVSPGEYRKNYRNASPLTA